METWVVEFAETWTAVLGGHPDNLVQGYEDDSRAKELEADPFD